MGEAAVTSCDGSPEGARATAGVGAFAGATAGAGSGAIAPLVWAAGCGAWGLLPEVNPLSKLLLPEHNGFGDDDP